MTDRNTLRERIELAIARTTFSRAAAAILVDIETTHVVVAKRPQPREAVSHALRFCQANSDRALALDEQDLSALQRLAKDLEDPT